MSSPRTPRVLSQAQRESYFENGYIVLEHIVPDDVVAHLRAVTEEMVERSKAISESDAVWDLDEGHSAGNTTPETALEP